LRVERLTLGEARRRVPALVARPRAVFHFPDDHRVNNERLGIAVALAARRAGARIREGIAAVAVLARRGRVAGIETGAGRIDAPVVVNAAGAWAADLRVPGGMSVPVFPVRGQMLVLRGPLGALGCPLYSRRGYLVPRLDGRILAGSTLERAGFGKRVTVAAAADLLAAVRAMAPGLATLSLDDVYAGLRPATPDLRPIIGPTRAPRGLHYATGHYRSGIVLAPVTADAVADLIVAGRTMLPVAGMSPDRFARRRRRR